MKGNSNDLVRLVGLEEKKDALYKHLSGGLKKKVGLAIALVNNPEIVFLDEPTTGLDPAARREVWKIIEDLRNRGRTIFLTTHYLEEAERLGPEVIGRKVVYPGIDEDEIVH